MKTSLLRAQGSFELRHARALAGCLSARPLGCRHLLGAFTESDWHSLYNAATVHGVRAALHFHLNTAVSVPTIVRPIIRALRESFLKNALRNAALCRDLREVLSSFNEAGISAIALKGAHLAQLVADHPGVRQMADIDLWVGEASLPAATKALRQLGYTCADSEMNWERWHERNPFAHHLPSFAKPGHPRIELHWRLPELFDPALQDRIRDRAQRAMIAGIHARVLSPEDLILHLCLHCRLHRFQQGLRPIYDLARVLYHHPVIDWKYLVSTARIAGAERCLHLGLWLAQELMHVPLPDELLMQTRAQRIDPGRKELARNIVLMGEGAGATGRYSHSLIDFLDAWRKDSTLSGRLKLVRQNLFPKHRYTNEPVTGNQSAREGATGESHALRALELLKVGTTMLYKGEWRELDRMHRWNEWLREAA